MNLSPDVVNVVGERIVTDFPNVVPVMTFTWGAGLAGFARHQQAARRSPGTIRLYRYRLLDLAERHQWPAAVTTEQLEAMLARGVAAGWAAETSKSVRTAYRAFYRWAHGAGHVERDPAASLPSMRVPAGVPKPSPERILRAALDRADPRERLMLMLAAYAGLRCCEIAGVRAAWWDGQFLTVLGKGDKWRRVPITRAELVAELDALVERGGVAFPNRWTGQPITRGHVSRLLSAALPPGETGHKLRHRFVTVTLDHTKDLMAVAEVVGHASTLTTQRYARTGRDRLLAVADAA